MVGNGQHRGSDTFVCKERTQKSSRVLDASNRTVPSGIPSQHRTINAPLEPSVLRILRVCQAQIGFVEPFSKRQMELIF